MDYLDTKGWRARKKERREKRQGNLEYSTKWLKDRKVEFKSFNNGILLRVKDYDFYPSTGYFVNIKTNEKGRGVRHLYERVKKR